MSPLSSSSGEISNCCGSLHTRNVVMHFFRQVNFRILWNYTEIWWTILTKKQSPAALNGPMASLESVMWCRLQFSPPFHLAFMEECSVLCLINGDATLTASKYDIAIDMYTAAIDLNYTSDIVFANQSKAKLGKMLWEDALLDAQKVWGIYDFVVYCWLQLTSAMDRSLNSILCLMLDTSDTYSTVWCVTLYQSHQGLHNHVVQVEGCSWSTDTR